jgi:hypothetical protein
MKCGQETARKENINCQAGEISYKNATNIDIIVIYYKLVPLKNDL